MKILVVDDNPLNREYLRQLFAGVGHEVVEAGDGTAALERLEAEDVRLIVSDLLMPRMDGFQFCREVKGTPRWARIPLLVYTATYTDPKDEAFVLSLGAERFLVKPAEPAVLLTAVADLMATNPVAAPSRPAPPDGPDLLEIYNSRLIQKLESKVLELDRTRRELQQANESLRESESRFREIFQNAGDAIYLVAVEAGGGFRFEDLNPAGERFIGAGAGEVRGRTLADVFGGLGWAGLAERLRRCVGTGLPESFEEPRETPSGYRTLQTLLAPVRDESATIRRIVAISRDVTPEREAAEVRRRLERHLQQTQKLEALGTLAGGVAHDFNNILTAILGHAELLRLDSQTPASREGINDLVNAALRARDLVQQILTFSRRQPRQRIPVLLGPVVAESMRLMRASTPATIRIESRVEPGERTVLADSGQIHQVLVNLCTNAVQAMAVNGGTLSVVLEPVRLETEFRGVNPAIPPGDYSRLTVRDNGCGMDAGTLARLFEPFFTTRAPGGGTGLGLAVVYGILHAHDAAVGVESGPGRGTAFTIWFPAVEADPEGPAADAAEFPRGHGEHVLVVDDEPALCRLAGLMLGHLGYRSTLHSSPAAALADFAGRPGDFDAVLTDLTMPDIPGQKFAEAILGIRPGIPVLLTSGYAGAIDPTKARDLVFGGLVTKPYTLASLSQAFHEALGSTESRTTA